MAKPSRQSLGTFRFPHSHLMYVRDPSGCQQGWCPRKRGGCLGYTLNKRWGSKRTLCTDVFSVLQPNQCDCSSKVSGFCPSLGHSLPLEQKGPGCHFHPGDRLGLLWNLKGQRLFLAGAEVQIQARNGEVETRGRLLLAGVLPSGLKSLSSPWGLGSCANGKRRGS